MSNSAAAPVVPATPENIERAARLIRQGGLVAFPTETVYGLGANALDAAAVERLFAVKGRPANSPLIVHVASAVKAREIALEWPRQANELAAKFWPGPLTLVLAKQPWIPDRVTAGLPSVGIRVPGHPVALALLEAAGVPVAAPSANPFSALSPTAAAHVAAHLGASVDLILDGGPSRVGLESTVLSLTGGQARLLRPGMISRTRIEAVIGPIEAAPSTTLTAGDSHVSPGLHARHYSPRTSLVLVPGPEHLPHQGRGVYLARQSRPGAAAELILMPEAPELYAARLYALLHELDAQGFDWIAVDEPPTGPDWQAIRDRLERASHR